MKIKKFISDHKVELAATIIVSTITVAGIALLGKSHEQALRQILDSSELVVRLNNREVAKDILAAMKDLPR